MEYRTLRGTGATISRVSLGTMTFGREVDEADSIRMIEMALDAGVNFIDEADIYARGRSEEIVGKALQGKRDDVVLVSKVGNFSGTNRQRDSGLHRWHVIRGVEECLRRLRTDRLDVCYLHRPDYRTPIEETLAAFDMLMQQGKVLYVGMSNHAAWQVCEALWKCDRNRWAPPSVIQVPYNLLTRSVEEECVAFCNKMSIGLTVYNPLAGGMLTGKYRQDAPPGEGTRFAANREYYQRFWLDANFDALRALAEIAQQAGKSMVELSLQWLLSQPHVDAVTVGASKIAHLEQNLRACEERLDEATLAACDQVWKTIRGSHFAYNR